MVKIQWTDDDSVNERRLNALTWQYFLGLEPEGWDDRYYITIANRVTLFIETSFYTTQPLRLTWMRRPEPLIAIWLLQVWGWNSLTGGSKATPLFPLLHLNLEDWFCWWFLYCWFNAPEFKNRRKYRQYALAHNKTTHGIDDWELGRIGTEVPTIFQVIILEAYPEESALFHQLFNIGNTIFPETLKFWEKIDSLYQMYQTSLQPELLQDVIGASFVIDTP